MSSTVEKQPIRPEMQPHDMRSPDVGQYVDATPGSREARPARRRAKKNLNTSYLTELRWDDPEEIQKSLDELYRYTCNHVQQAEDWYLHKKGCKKGLAISIRLATIFCVGAAGILPIMSVLFENSSAYFSAFASISVLLAGVLIGVDKHLGLTSGWTRFLLTQQKISICLEKFQFDWQEIMFEAAASGDHSGDIVKEAIQSCKLLMIQVRNIVLDETKMWAEEFTSTLAQMESVVKQQRALQQEQLSNRLDAARLAAVTVSLKNDGVTDWGLSLDGRKSTRARGSKSIVSKLSPGVHKLRVDGVVAGQKLVSEMAVNVARGETKDISVMLEP